MGRRASHLGYGFRVRKVRGQQYVEVWEYGKKGKKASHMGSVRKAETWKKLSAWLKERGEKAAAEARVAIEDINDRARAAETEAIGNGDDSKRRPQKE